MMTRHFAEALIQHGWQPYIAGHWMTIPGKSGYIITFKGHEQHEFKCSHKVGDELLTMVKEVK